MAVLVLVGGCSQSGKNTLISKFTDEFQNKTIRLPTGTSRTKRPEEIDGRDKIFLTEDEFVNHPVNFLEIVKEHGNYYGVVKRTLIEFLKKYEVVLLDIEIRGIKSILSHNELLPEHTLIFSLHTNTIEELFERVRRKGDANAETRIESVKQEWKWKNDSIFTHHINTSCTIEESYREFKKIILESANLNS